MTKKYVFLTGIFMLAIVMFVVAVKYKNAQQSPGNETIMPQTASVIDWQQVGKARQSPVKMNTHKSSVVVNSSSTKEK